MENEQVTNDQSTTSTSENKGVGLGWKVLVAVVALVIIATLVYPLLQEPSNLDDNSGASIEATTIETEAILQSDSTSAEELFEQGNAYVQAGQLEQAVAVYQQAIELDPNYQAVYANLGVVYYQLEQLDLAALQYEKALELDPNDGEVTYNLGALRLQQALLGGSQPDPDLVDEAITQLQHALELKPDLAEPHFSLGVAYATLNREEEAIREFESFLAQDSGQDPRASQEARRYLDVLQSQ